MLYGLFPVAGVEEEDDDEEVSARDEEEEEEEDPLVLLFSDDAEDPKRFRIQATAWASVSLPFCLISKLGLPY